jgi:ribonuclease G
VRRAEDDVAGTPRDEGRSGPDDAARQSAPERGGEGDGASRESAEEAPRERAREGGRTRRGGRTSSRKKAETPAAAEGAPGEGAATTETAVSPGAEGGEKKPRRRRRTSTPAGGEPDGGEPEKKPSRRRRRPTTDEPQTPDEPRAAGEPQSADGSAVAAEAPKKPRRRRRTAATTDETPAVGEAAAAEKADEPEKKPRRRRRATATPGESQARAGDAQGAGAAGQPGAGAVGQQAAGAADRSTPVVQEPSAEPSGGAQGSDGDDEGDGAKKPGRRRRGGRRRKKAETADGAAPGAQSAVPDDELVREVAGPAPVVTGETRSDARRDASQAAEILVGGEGDGDGADESRPARRRRGSRGGRRSRARKAKLAAAEREALDRAASEVAPEHGALLPEDELRATDETAATAPAFEGAPPDAATARGREAAALEPAGGEAAPAAETTTPTRRRRGRRGRAGAQPAGAATAAEPVEAATGVEPVETGDEPAEAATRASGEGEKAAPEARPKKGGRERPQRRERGRPKAIVRENAARAATPPSDREAAGVSGPEPVEHKIILVSEQRNELRVALVEDGRLSEMYFERPGKQSMLGDIYRARVENVVPGMDAAFIDFGLEKNGFLYVDEVETEDGRRRGRRITDVLKPGQEITVQVMKDPMGSKGARLTTHLSLAGRYLVYVPGGSGVGVSRRLPQSERERLRDLSKQLRPRNAGLIVRTYAKGKGLDELRTDLQYLSRLWSRLKKKAETVKAPGLVYDEVDIALEVARDTFNDTCEKMLVDDEKPVQGHQGVSRQDRSRARGARRAPHRGRTALRGPRRGGADRARARAPRAAAERRQPRDRPYRGADGDRRELRALHQRAFARGHHPSTNMEAAREVVRQLRLRDIGGIIVIDFIDMAHARNREAVLAKLEAELETDRTKTYVVELSPLGLVEMTRQNTTDGARGILTRTCQTCLGKARVLSEETVALAVERRVRAHARKSGAKALLLEVHRGVAERLEADGRLKQLERETKRRVLLEGSSTVPVDSIRILAEGSLAHVQELRCR